MAIKYEFLEELKNVFVDALEKAEQEAKNEQEYDALSDIVEDLLAYIPITLCQKDYFMRNVIRDRMATKDKNNSELVNKVMQYLHSQDAIYIGDYAIENIDECIDEIQIRDEIKAVSKIGENNE